MHIRKIVETWISKCLTEWTNSNNIIGEFHHGGRQGYSTLTAISNIQNTIDKNLFSNNFNVLFTTDLSAAFDTIDHEILLKKWNTMALKERNLGF